MCELSIAQTVGHVITVMGFEEYDDIVRKYKIPIVVAKAE
jgi:hydrogenase maturation factor